MSPLGFSLQVPLVLLPCNVQRQDRLWFRWGSTKRDGMLELHPSSISSYFFLRLLVGVLMVWVAHMSHALATYLQLWSEGERKGKVGLVATSISNLANLVPFWKELHQIRVSWQPWPDHERVPAGRRAAVGCICFYREKPRGVRVNAARPSCISEPRACWNCRVFHGYHSTATIHPPYPHK